MTQDAKPARREFLTYAASGLTIAQSAYAAGSDVLRLGLIGCGGRGTEGAGQALFADKGVRLVALTDVLTDRAQEKRNTLRVKFPDQVPARDEDCFGGFEGYKRVIAACDVVIIANAASSTPARDGRDRSRQARVRGEAARH